MQLNARFDNFNGEGSKVYQVIFTDLDGDIRADEINVEIWLANNEEHLNEQLREEYVGQGTFDEEIFEEILMEGCVIKEIGTVINVTND